MKMNSTDYRSFIFGCILGDGSLKHGTFYTSQTDEDLIRFKEKVFNRNCNTNVTVTKHRYKNKKDVYGLYVSSNEYLKKLCNRYCRQLISTHRVNVTSDLLHKLTPLGIAIWFADDGTTILVGKTSEKIKSRRVQFCTDRYSYDEVLTIQSYFKKRYGGCSLIKRKDGVYRVQLSLDGAMKMFLEIQNYFIKYFPSLLYKLDLGYRNVTANGFSHSGFEAVKNYISNTYNIISSYPQFRDRLSDIV